MCDRRLSYPPYRIEVGGEKSDDVPQGGEAEGEKARADRQ